MAGKPIQLVELQALSDGINVALGKSASQSSTFVTRTGNTYGHLKQLMGT
jgi:hypothetical protein